MKQVDIIFELGVALTPGLVINGKLVSSGKIPTKSTNYHRIEKATKKQRLFYDKANFNSLYWECLPESDGRGIVQII